MARPKIEDLAQWQSQTPRDVWAELMRARREEVVLRAVLKPFADVARRVPHMSNEGAALISVADCRTALKAMEGE